MSAWQFSFLGYKARLLHPEYLLLVAAVAAAGTLFFVAWLRRTARVRREIPERLRARVLPGWSPARQGSRLGLALSGVLLLSAALVQPQCGTGTELARKVGIDVVVALDVSRSMMARDVKPSRLERARLELTDLIDRLKGDRFGLVVFAGSSFVQCPLTTDYAAAKLFLKAVDPSAMPRQGTNLGAALRQAQDLLSTREGTRSQVVVLLTDGENHGPDALSAAKALEDDGIKVFAVGIGSPAGEPIPVLSKSGQVVGYKKDREGNTVLSRLDEATLEEIADTTGGTYVHAASGVGISEVVKALDDLEKAEFESRMTTRFEDRSALLMVPGFLLLLLGTLLRASRPPRRPRTQDGSGRPPASGRRSGAAAAAVLLLVSPLLGGWRPFESEHPVVAEGNEAFATGDYDKALEAYDRALEAEKEPANRARIEYNRGTAYAAKGDAKAAKEAFQSALAGADDGLKAKDFYNLGTGLLSTGDPKGASEALVRSLKLDPSNGAAKYNLELALRKLKEQQNRKSGQSQQQDDSQQGDDSQQAKNDAQSEDSKGEQQAKNDQKQDGSEQQQGQDAQQAENDQKQDGSEQQQGQDTQQANNDQKQDGSEQQQGQDAQQANNDQKQDGSEQEQQGQGEQDEEQAKSDEQQDGSQQEKPDEAQAKDEPSQEEKGERPDQAPGQPHDADGAPGSEKAMAAAPAEVSEQDAERILEALRRGEKPLQMQLFNLKDYDPKERGPEEKDW